MVLVCLIVHQLTNMVDKGSHEYIDINRSTWNMDIVILVPLLNTGRITLW